MGYLTHLGSPTYMQTALKNYLQERHHVKRCRKGKNNVELFDLWKKAAVMKQIQISSCAKDRKILLEDSNSIIFKMEMSNLWNGKYVDL